MQNKATNPFGINEMNFWRQEQTHCFRRNPTLRDLSNPFNRVITNILQPHRGDTMHQGYSRGSLP